jgi:hypothetical protein
MLIILNAHNPAASHPVPTTSEKLESVTAPKAAKRLSNGGAVKTRKSGKGDDPVSVTETDSEEEETVEHGEKEKQEAKLDEGSDDTAAVTATREVLRFTLKQGFCCIQIP